jgi:Flp pilus assembly protein TadG
MPASLRRPNRVAHQVQTPAGGATGRGILRRLQKDKAGTVGMMFGLLVIPLTAVVGIAVDFGRTYSVMSHTQAALDAAALAAGRVAQVETTDMINKASTAANAYFDQAKPTNVVSTKLVFTPNSTQTQFAVTATSWVRTPFLGTINALFHKGSEAGAPAGCQGNHYGCIKLVTTATAELKVGGNGQTNVEIAMMLDVTGSMAGQKLIDLKSAASDLVDIVVWDDQSQYTSRIGLAPFSQAVNVGSTYFTAVTGKADDPDPDGDGYNYPDSCYNKKGKLKAACDGDSDYKAKKYTKCVVERTGNTAFTDASPATKYLTPLDDVDSTPQCLPSAATIVPMTKNKQVLKDMITSFVANGSTAGHLGTAWAWYLLSPNWSGVWPAESKPTAYKTANTKKIAVLMTDGEYNIDYKSSSNGSSTTQARTLCANMKAANVGIEIYTVGFDLGGNQTAITTLSQCATDASHFYNTSTGDQLRQAFRDIALKISTLRLTQ